MVSNICLYVKPIACSDNNKTAIQMVRLFISAHLVVSLYSFRFLGRYFQCRRFGSSRLALLSGQTNMCPSVLTSILLMAAVWKSSSRTDALFAFHALYSVPHTLAPLRMEVNYVTCDWLDGPGSRRFISLLFTLGFAFMVNLITWSRRFYPYVYSYSEHDHLQFDFDSIFVQIKTAQLIFESTGSIITFR